MTDKNSLRERLPLSRRQFMIVAAAGGLSALGTAAGLDDDGESGKLTAGNMALSQAYKISDGIWLGPASARTNVSAENGDLYMASDTDVDYYYDGGWNLRSIGSSTTAVPSVTTEQVNNVYRAEAFDGADGGEQIQAALDAADNAPGRNAVVVGPVGPDTITGSDGNSHEAWAYSTPPLVPSNTQLHFVNAYLYLKDESNDNLLRNENADSGDSTRDSEITISGTAWFDGNASNQTRQSNQYENNGWHFFKVDDLIIDGTFHVGPTNAWGVVIEDVLRADLDTFIFHQDGNTTNQDGLNIVGPAEEVSAGKVIGDCNDDSCAIKTTDPESIRGPGGDVSDVTVESVVSNSPGANLVRFVGGSMGGSGAFVMDGVQVNNVSGTADTAISFGAAVDNEPTADEFKNIVVDGLRCDVGSGPAIVSNSPFEATLRDITVTGSVRVFSFLNDVGRLTVEDMYAEFTSDLLKNNDNNVTRFRISDSTFIHSSTNWGFVWESCTGKHHQYENMVIEATGSRAGLAIHYNSACDVDHVQAENIRVNNYGKAADVQSGAITDGRFNGFSFDSNMPAQKFDVAEGIIVNGAGHETNTSESPSFSLWELGDEVDYVDSDDGSGTGYYKMIQDSGGSREWKQLA